MTKKMDGRNIAKAGTWIGLLLVACIAAANAEQSILEQTSEEFAKIAEETRPAVVSIRVEKTVEVGAGGAQPFPFNNPFEFFGEDFMRRFFPEQGQRRPQLPRQREFRRQGAGSGFLISKDGYILSNNHVVGDADKITVRLHDGREFEAERIGTDPQSEVAVIKIEGNDFPILKLADSAEIQVGELVIAIGNPFGLAESLTTGVISAKGRRDIGIADYEDFIQTDAAINPGNSGGPLLNAQGEAIGINTAIYSRTGGFMGIGFAIPINMAKFVKEQLIETGKVIRSYLGITIQAVTDELAESFGMDKAEGILISHVAQGSAAEEGDLKSGDIILALNGEKVENVADFRNTVAAEPPGTQLKLVIFRDGATREIDVTTGAFPSAGEEITLTSDEMARKLGITVRKLTTDLAERFGYEPEEGVIISEIIYGSPAAMAGIRPGNLITSVNRVDVSTVDEFRAALAKSVETGRVLLHVTDDRGSRFVVLNVE